MVGLLGALPLPAFGPVPRRGDRASGLTQLPIALAPFRGEADAPQKIAAIVQADLERSGQFRAVDTTGAALDETQPPRRDALARRRAPIRWRRAASAGWRTAATTCASACGTWCAAQDLGGQSYAVTAGDLRLAAHRIADFIYEKLTGEKGIFSTRIAYVTKAGTRYNLWVADADGENAQSALASPEPIISPAWSPNGAQLAYVSFESRKPVVYVHDVASGQRRLVANFRGSNSAPAWSPDGRTLAVTLSREGGSQLYTIDADGGEPRAAHAVGRHRHRAGVLARRPQHLFRQRPRRRAADLPHGRRPAAIAERVTFTGSYNISPALSPDGKWLAYISRIGGAFKLQVMELGGGACNVDHRHHGGRKPELRAQRPAHHLRHAATTAAKR